MASFQAKIFWKRPRKRETKNYRFFCFYQTRYIKFQKNSNKIQRKNKNTTVASFQAKIG